MEVDGDEKADENDTDETPSQDSEDDMDNDEQIPRLEVQGDREVYRTIGA